MVFVPEVRARTVNMHAHGGKMQVWSINSYNGVIEAIQCAS